MSDPIDTGIFGQRMSLQVEGQFALPISTSISEGGIGGGGAVIYEYWLSKYHGYGIGLEGRGSETVAKLMPSTSTNPDPFHPDPLPGTANETTPWNIAVTWERLARRPFAWGGDVLWRWSLDRTSIGGGRTMLHAPTRELGGESFVFEDQTFGHVEIGHTSGGGAEFRLSDNFVLIPYAAITNGVRYLLMSDEERESLPHSSRVVALQFAIRLGRAGVASEEQLAPRATTFEAIGELTTIYGVGVVETALGYDAFLGPAKAGSDYVNHEVMGIEGGTTAESTEDLALLRRVAERGKITLGAIKLTLAHRLSVAGQVIEGISEGGLVIFDTTTGEYGSGLAGGFRVAKIGMVAGGVRDRTIFASWVPTGMLLSILGGSVGGTFGETLRVAGFETFAETAYLPNPSGDPAFPVREVTDFAVLSLYDGPEGSGSRGQWCTTNYIGQYLYSGICLSAPHLNGGSILHRSDMLDGEIPDRGLPADNAARVGVNVHVAFDDADRFGLDLGAGVRVFNGSVGSGEPRGGFGGEAGVFLNLGPVRVGGTYFIGTTYDWQMVQEVGGPFVGF